MNNDDIDKAAEFIKSGGVVAFPTETVYGLGANATNQEASLKIFKIKGRPSINPLIIHVSTLEMAEEIGEFNAETYTLAKHFWPGPLSIVLPLKSNSGIASCALAGNSTVALRLPAHPVAIALIRAVGYPVAAPSANPSGYISSTLSVHVTEHFEDKGVFILQCYNGCQYGLESTIIDLSCGGIPIILRYGFITPDALEEVLKKPIQIAGTLMQIKAPGMIGKHYSPHASLRLNAKALNYKEIGLNFGKSDLIKNYSLNLSIKGDFIEAANNLYKMLRVLDKYALRNKISTIAVAPIPNTGIGLALNDKLKRAVF